MGWKIIEIENSYSLSLFLNNIVFYDNNKKITININDIDVLLINNFTIKFTAQLVNALSQANVLVIICDNKCLPCSQIVPIIGNYNTLKVLDNQLKWNHQWKSITWQNIIKMKIFNQAWFAKYILNNDLLSEKILDFRKDVKEYDVTNREGHVAKIYWHNLFGIEFKRFDDDYTNKLLNYGYTILRSYFVRSIIKKGLDPRISLFHKSFHNYFSLASDLMEPFRVIVDIAVYKIFLIGEVDFYNHKQSIIELFNMKIKINDNLQYINNAIDIFIDAIVNQSELPRIEIINEFL